MSLTVKELVIMLLHGFDSDATVYVEGCDCTGEANGVKEYEEGAVLITRPDGVG